MPSTKNKDKQSMLSDLGKQSSDYQRNQLLKRITPKLKTIRGDEFRSALENYENDHGRNYMASMIMQKVQNADKFVVKYLHTFKPNNDCEKLKFLQTYSKFYSVNAEDLETIKHCFSHGIPDLCFLKIIDIPGSQDTPHSNDVRTTINLTDNQKSKDLSTDSKVENFTPCQAYCFCPNACPSPLTGPNVPKMCIREYVKSFEKNPDDAKYRGILRMKDHLDIKNIDGSFTNFTDSKSVLRILRLFNMDEKKIIDQKKIWVNGEEIDMTNGIDRIFKNNDWNQGYKLYICDYDRKKGTYSVDFTLGTNSSGNYSKININGERFILTKNSIFMINDKMVMSSTGICGFRGIIPDSDPPRGALPTQTNQEVHEMSSIRSDQHVNKDLEMLQEIMLLYAPIPSVPGPVPGPVSVPVTDSVPVVKPKIQKLPKIWIDDKEYDITNGINMTFTTSDSCSVTILGNSDSYTVKVRGVNGSTSSNSLVDIREEKFYILKNGIFMKNSKQRISCDDQGSIVRIGY